MLIPRTLPLTQQYINPTISKQTQFLSEIEIPKTMRKHVYAAYANYYNANL